MKKIFFITPAPYESVSDGVSLYKSFDLMAKGDYDPGVKVEAVGYLKRGITDSGRRRATKIYSSTSRRALETARSLREALGLEAKIMSLPLANEIYFQMDELMTEKEFKRLGVNEARKRFFDRLVKDFLSEPLGSIYQRALKLLKLMLKDVERGEVVLCCSHSFFMKMVEVMANNPRVFFRPEAFLDYFDGSKKAYRESGDGFELGIEKVRNVVKMYNQLTYE